MNQRSTNPFPFSDTNKRYHTFDYFARQTFGGKCVRVSLDAGFTCPNKDGTAGVGGCLFCAGGSSGAAAAGSVEEQYGAGIERIRQKWTADRFIPYLQANTNTYAPPDVLEALYSRCAALPGAVMLAIGTRADCLSPEVMDVLVRTSETIPLLVELGMQTVHEPTLSLIRRGYGHEEFLRGYRRLREAGGNIRVGLHILNGLPGESREQMLQTAAEAAQLAPDMVKLHTLCVLRETDLAPMYEAGEYVPLTVEETVPLVCDQLELLPPQTVIARLSADAEKERLLAPLWVRNKRGFENAVDTEMMRRGSMQGLRFCGSY